jgi:AcrR family transcriptional regulator
MTAKSIRLKAQPQPPRPPGRPRDESLPERRRAEILAVATAMFAQHGFADTDVQQIADRVGVGKGTVYRYFATKEALFLAAVDWSMRRLRGAVDAAADNAETPLGRIGAGVRAYLEFFDRNPDVVELLIQERAQFRDRQQPTYFQHRDANLGPWRELFQDLIRQGVLRDIPVDRITDVISDLLYGTMFTTYFAGRKKTLSSQCEDILDLLFRGLLARPEGALHG